MKTENPFTFIEKEDVNYKTNLYIKSGLSEETKINVSEYSEWKCYLFGLDNYVLFPSKGKYPNWFWRWMQYICFGNKWVKNENR